VKKRAGVMDYDEDGVRNPEIQWETYTGKKADLVREKSRSTEEGVTTDG